MRGPTTLITGASGFLGRELVRELRARRPGLPLILLGKTRAPGVSACDLRDRRRTAGMLLRARPRTVFHLAGETRPLPWAELWEAHVLCTANLLDGLRLLPRPAGIRVVVVGSSQEYGAAAGARGSLPEDTPPEPVNAYGATKLCASLLALSRVEDGPDVRLARIFNLMGPGMHAHHALGSFVRQIARIERGLQPPRLTVGDLSSRRDYVDVRDAARALLDIAEKGRRGETYNVCSGVSRSLEEMLGFLLSLTAARIRVRPDRALRRRVDASGVAGDRRKALRSLGWKPLVAACDGLRDALEWERSAY